MSEEKYRKILDGVMEQAEKDFGEDINGPNKTELSGEKILQKVEYCISRNGICNGCKYTMEYHKECSCSVLHDAEILFNAIHRLQDENAKQKAEIERLTTRCEIAEGTKHRLTIFDRIEIHDKAVKDTAKEILCELLDIEVKDENYETFFLDVCDKLERFAEKYGVEVE